MGMDGTIPLEDTNVTSSNVAGEVNPPTWSRRLTIASYLALFLLGLPYWWHTTSIERLPLPSAPATSSFDSFKITSVCLSPTTRPSDSEGYRPHQQLVRAIEESADAWYGRHDSQRDWRIQTSNESSEDCDVVIKFENPGTGKESQPRLEETSRRVSGWRQSQLIIPIGDSEASKRGTEDIPSTTAAALVSLFPPLKRSYRALAYSPNVTLSFVLLNQDSSLGGWVNQWEIDEALNEWILPVLGPLTALHKFSIETQILYQAPLRFNPSYLERASDTGSDSWVVSQDQMKNFVNSEQWSLDSGSSNNPVLRFLLFIPSVAHTPMRLESAHQSPAFLLPQYGSVVIDNALSEHVAGASARCAAIILTKQDLQQPFAYFTHHLKALLGVPGEPPLVHKHNSPLSDWQVQNLLRMRTLENIKEATETLGGIQRLVAKIREMKVGLEVQKDVEVAVGYLRQMATRAPVLPLTTLFELSRDALWLANRAFFNPTMVGLLYFPDEHKYAVYAPLFAPIAVPIVVSTIKEFKQWSHRRRNKRA